MFWLLLAWLLGTPSGFFVGAFLKKFNTTTNQDVANQDFVGASGMLRRFGWRVALLVFLTDIAKAFLAVWLVARFAPNWLVFAPASVIFGNCFPVLGMRHAGQGVSTLIGAWFVMDPTWCALTLLSAFVVTALHQALRLERFVVLKSVPFAALCTLLPLLGLTLWLRPSWVGLALGMGLAVAVLRGAVVLFGKIT